MKLALFIPLSLLLASCATRHAPVVRVTPHAVPGTTLPSERMESVRYAENIRAYPLGRYIDPNNSRIMHEGHTLYRVESTSKWNLHPNRPVAVPLGPVTRIRDAAHSAGALGDELTVELNRQKEATKAVIQGGQIISQKLDQVSASVQQTKQVAAQNAMLQQEVNTTKQRLDALEEELRRKQRAERATAPVSAQKDDKSEW